MKNLSELTPKEYHNYFKDCLNSLIKKTFSKDEVLVFVTYQPTAHTLDYSQVMSDTNILFNQNKYVEVIERTFKTSRLFNDGGYTDGFHSHVIMKETEFNAIKDEISDMDIVTKVVYNLAGLIKYLSKQAGTTYHRLLPIQYIPPVTTTGPGKVIREKIIKPIKKKLTMFFSIIGDVAATVVKNIIKPSIKVIRAAKRLIKVGDTT